MRKNEKIKSAILSVYPSESAAASAIGWDRRRLNKITTGRKVPDVMEVATLADAVHKPIGEVAQFFLPKKSPNGQLLT